MNSSPYAEHVLTGGPAGDVAELTRLLQAILATLQGMGGGRRRGARLQHAPGRADRP
jgi:hypothetical protein